MCETCLADVLYVSNPIFKDHDIVRASKDGHYMNRKRTGQDFHFGYSITWQELLTDPTL